MSGPPWPKFADGVRDNLGCQLALDDFGTGHTSCTYLKYFPVDMVKIDGDFVHDLPNSPVDQAIVRSLVQVCRELGIRTAAERVQDQATSELLRTYGVDFVQGYHIGRPVPVATTARPYQVLGSRPDTTPPVRHAAMGQTPTGRFTGRANIAHQPGRHHAWAPAPPMSGDHRSSPDISKS